MSRLRPLAWCLCAAILFGASTPLAQALLDDFGPLHLAGLLYLGAALAVLPFARGGTAALRRQPRQLLRLGGIVACGGMLAPVLLLLALQRAPAGSVSLLLNLEPVLTGVLATLLFREHLGRRAPIAYALIVVAGAGLALPSLFGVQGAETLPAGSVAVSTIGASLAAGSVVAALLAAASCLCWAIDNNLSSVLDGFTPPQIVLAKGLIAGTVNLALGAMTSSPPQDSGLGVKAVVLALALGGLSYGLSIVLYVKGAQALGAARSQAVFALGPFFGLLLAWTLLGESPARMQVMAALIMAAGVAVLLTGRHEHAHAHEATTHVHAHRHDDGHHAHEHEHDERISPGAWHSHAHSHGAISHSHLHEPDIHHRHLH